MKISPKIVISDYENSLNRDLEYEMEMIREEFPDAEIIVHPFKDNETLFDVLKGADGLITAYLTIDKYFFDNCPSVRAISINATGYTCVDLEEAEKKNVDVCAASEYCTDEVADFTMALMLALAKKLKVHEYNLEKRNIWDYEKAGKIIALKGSTLAVFGFGRIGQAVAKRAQAFGIDVVAIDPNLPENVAKSLNVRLVSTEYAQEHAHIISNHMSVTDENSAFFDSEFFNSLKQSPIFLNLARGVSVDEKALIDALDKGLLSSAGLDVMIDESPDPSKDPIFGREDVIITPHAAFYSEASIKNLQFISTRNLCKCLSGRKDLADRLL